MKPDDKRQTCECGHRYGDHALDRTRPGIVEGGWRCLAWIGSDSRETCTCQRWKPGPRYRMTIQEVPR